MRRKLLILSFMLIIFSFFTACGKKEIDPNEVTNFLKDLYSYSTDYVMEIKNDKQIITYEGKQFFSKKLGYRMELASDRVFVYKEDKIYVEDIKNNVRYTMEQGFDNGYRLSFVEEYVKLLYTNEEIKYSFKEIDGVKYQLIELIIPGGSNEMSKAVLYVNLKNSLPEQLSILDDKDNERRKITYRNFQCNPELQESLFKVDMEKHE